MKSTFLIISFAILATSCGTKKKVVSKIKEKTEIDSTATTSENISKVEKSAEKSETKTKEETDFLSIEFEGVSGDSLHIIKRDENGKIKESITYTGKGKVTSTKGTIKTDTSSNKIKNNVLGSLKINNSKTIISKKTDVSQLNKSKETGYNWILWIFLFFSICFGVWLLLD